jgi:hypothetical protein
MSVPGKHGILGRFSKNEQLVRETVREAMWIIKKTRITINDPVEMAKPQVRDNLLATLDKAWTLLADLDGWPQEDDGPD